MRSGDGSSTSTGAKRPDTTGPRTARRAGEGGADLAGEAVALEAEAVDGDLDASCHRETRRFRIAAFRGRRAALTFAGDRAQGDGP